MLTCLNCSEPVLEGQAKCFAEVFVCPLCFEIAERLYRKSEQELRGLLLLQREAIREALINGRLHLSPQVLEDVPKADLLRAVVEVTNQLPQLTP